MPFLSLALVTYAVAALFFVVAALWVRAVQGLFWLAGFGQGIIHGLRGVCVFSAPQPIIHGSRGVCPFLAPQPNPAVKRDAALKRVAPYF